MLTAKAFFCEPSFIHQHDITTTFIHFSSTFHRKINKKQGAGFLGCVKLLSSNIQRLKDTGYQKLELMKSGETENEQVKGQIVISLMSRDRGVGSHNAVADDLGNLTPTFGSPPAPTSTNNSATITTPSSSSSSNNTSNSTPSAAPNNNNNALVDGAATLVADPNDLPEGWSERRTATGRIQYLNHQTRTTHWERPTRPAIEYASDNPPPIDNNNPPTSPLFTSASPLRGTSNSITSPSSANSPSAALPSPHHHNHPHSHHQPMSDNVIDNGGPPPPLPTSPTSAPPPPPPPVSSTTEERSQPRRRSVMRRNYMSRTQLHEPVALPDGYEQRTTQQGQIYFLHTQTGVSTWHDPRVPRDLQINEGDLGPLPPGWEIRHTATGRIYFVNHNTRTTQFTDPRITSNLDSICTGP